MLNLDELGSRTYHRISLNIGNALAEAAAYCIESQSHQQDASLTVRGVKSGSYVLTWTPISQDARRGWNHPDEATEEGAAGIAVMLSFREIGYMVLSRSWRNSGFDYLIGDSNISNVSEPERKLTEEMSDILGDDGLVVRGRLEVSGIREGTDGTIDSRVNQKFQQTTRSDAVGVPAYVIVVEFGRLIAVVEENELRL
jgi:hypothetical protein